MLTDQPVPDTVQARAEAAWWKLGLRDPAALAVSPPQAQWEAYRGTILAAWIARRPGTRPSCWWRWDAPRVPASTLPPGWADPPPPEPRRLVAGKATATPRSCWWWEPRDGLPELRDVDPADPPRVEAQAVHLERHGLLLPYERECLGPADFAPEPVEDETRAILNATESP